MRTFQSVNRHGLKDAIIINAGSFTIMTLQAKRAFIESLKGWAVPVTSEKNVSTPGQCRGWQGRANIR